MPYTTKIRITNQKVEDFLDTIDEKRQSEAYQIIAMMESISGKKPLMLGSSMIGFGKYHYSSKGVYGADWFRIGFSPRKAKISIYLSCDLDEFSDELERLGKYSRGKGCLYVNKLSDIDMKVLEKMSKIAYENVKDFDASK